MLYNLEIGTAYDIQLHAPAILGTGYKSATVLGLLDYSSAIALEDVSAIHANIYPLLPNGTAINPAKLIYAKIRTTTEETRVLALEWMSAQPTVVSSTAITITITNVSQSNIPAITAILRANGYTSFTVL